MPRKRTAATKVYKERSDKGNNHGRYGSHDLAAGVDTHLNLVLYLLNGIQPAKRENWMRFMFPKTYAIIGWRNYI